MTPESHPLYNSQQPLPKSHQDPNMCRPDTDHRGPTRLLDVKAFYLNLKLSGAKCGYSYNDPLCGPLTLVYLPRLNGAPLEVDGSSIRPDSPAYVTLHRVVDSGGAGSVVFGSLERVRAGEGARFEVYVGEEKLLKGKFRRAVGGGWRVECTCALEGEIAGVAEAEVCVAVEGAGGGMSEKVAVEGRRRRRRRSDRSFGLEEIPEEEEEGACEFEGCCCCWESGVDGGDEREEGDLTAAEMECETEGGRWAVDLGLWAVCLGVGYLVSRASVKRLRRRRTLL